MDGKIVYTATKDTIDNLIHEEDLACRYHVVDSKTKEVIDGFDSYDEAESSAEISAMFKKRDFYVVDSRPNEPLTWKQAGKIVRREDWAWLSRLWKKLFG